MELAIFGGPNDPIGVHIANLFTKNTGHPVKVPFVAMGCIKDDRIVAQAIFTDYTEANIDIHIYAPTALNRKFVSAAYNYVFNQLKCERLTARIYNNNEKFLQLIPRLGFVYECTQESYYKKDGQIFDCIVYKLMKNNIPKWVKI